MINKTLILLTTSFFLFTACNDNTTADNTNTIADIVIDNSDNTAVENTTTSIITPISLNLSIDKTALNKDENTTVKVMGTYSDGTSKDVTESVEWIVSPSAAAEIKNTTLRALKDQRTTVKAKINTVTSEVITLNTTWSVNGHTLPPEPDKSKNDSMLLGIDSNNNNVRDDVERWIYATYKDKHPIYIDIAMQAGRAYKKVLETPEKAKEIREIVNAPLFCSSYYEFEAQFFNDPILITERIDTRVKSKYFNTKERSDVYWQYDKLLSGGVYDLPEDKDMKLFCDFNTTQYNE